MARAEGELRRRDHRRWRPRPGNRVLPGHPPRHHQRRSGRGRLHRLGQLRAQHHDHPRQLRNPGVDPLLQPQRGPVPQPGSGDRLLDHARQQGPHLDGPHRVGHARRTIARSAQQRLRSRDGPDRPDGDQAAVPADRPHRRRTLPGARRVVPRARLHGPARSCRVGLRPRSDAPRRSRAAGHRGHRPASRRRSRRGREDLARRHLRRRGDECRRRRCLDDRRPRRAAPAGSHSSAASIRHQRLRAGPRTDRLVDRPAVLRLANSTRADADRSRVRARVELLAAVVVPVPPVVFAEDGVPAAIRAQPQDPAAVDRPVRHLRRLLSDHGPHRGRRAGHLHGLGYLGVQGDSGRRRTDGRVDRHWAHARPHRPFALSRFAADHPMADQGSTGTR